MQREFLQEKSLSRRQGNSEKSLNVDLSAKSRLIPYSTVASMLGLNDLYVEERDACENYRMIFTVNPVCSNILYNAVTEPVYKEGSYSALTLVETPVSRNNEDIFEDIFPYGTLNMSGDTVDQIAAVRDTEYSHEKIGDFKYHCGYDIFNNHLLRSSEFEHVSMERNKGNKNEFNTIFDFAVDYNGKRTQRVIGESTGPAQSTATTGIRMYSLDTIKSMNAAFYDEMRNVDGWFGFYNTGYIEIPNAKLNMDDISLNMVLNNENRCSFIDLYPDRSLYSFIPKINRYKRRAERNWDCAIVYPFKNDYDMFAEINGNEANAVKVLSTEIVYDNVGDEQILMKSLLRHSLQPGDEIRLFYSGTTSPITRFSVPVTIVQTGNEKGEEKNRYFKIKLYDISSFCSATTDETGAKTLVKRGTEEKLNFFYKKIEGGYDDRYYFRKFKEMKNYQYVPCEETSEAVVLKREPSFVNENSPKYIKLGDEYFKLEGKPLAYTQNKIAFASNIFGDRVAQVIFNDDICITGLKDNLGRPLSTVYFAAIKTNRGHKEWYNSRITSADTVEFSHCFGEVTSGLDLPEDSGSTEYNVRKLHNVFKDELTETDYADGLDIIMEDAPTGPYNGTPTPIESGLTLSANTEKPYEFYGDVVEFSVVNYLETVLEKVYHRFNTAQRECLVNKNYFDIHYDELVGDLYDVGEINTNS